MNSEPTDTPLDELVRVEVGPYPDPLFPLEKILSQSSRATLRLRLPIQLPLEVPPEHPWRHEVGDALIGLAKCSFNDPFGETFIQRLAREEAAIQDGAENGSDRFA